LSLQAEFQRHPIRFTARRLIWHFRWAMTDAPQRLKLGGSLEILAPKGGAGALIYYRGYSEPETAQFIKDFLKPGMVVWDVGAHIGEYTLLAAQSIGETGHVEAFEPSPRSRNYLNQNVRLNSLSNVTVHRDAVSSQSGRAELIIDPEPSMCRLRGKEHENETDNTVSVDTTTLDAFRDRHTRMPNLVKVDIEGAEELALEGAVSLLDLPSEIAPVWVVEYAPENCQRFGYSATQIVSTFSTRGYQTYWISDTGKFISTAALPPWRTSGNLVAFKS
jgi:FkbM family methyltransferase